MNRFFLVTGVFLWVFAVVPLWGQQVDTLSAAIGPDSIAPEGYKTLNSLTFPDSTILTPVRDKGPFIQFFAKGYPNPRKAALFSFILPGAGQVYNKKWWKLPIVYGAFGTLIWIEARNVREYRAARENYRWIVDGDATTEAQGKFAGRSAASVKDYRDTYRRYVEFGGIGLGLAYLLTAADAFVDAHLSRFDVSEDLSLHWRPVPAPGGPAWGLTFQVDLGRP